MRRIMYGLVAVVGAVLMTLVPTGVLSAGATTSPPTAGTSLPTAGSAGHASGVSPLNTITACGGNNYPPTGWTAVATREWYGGAYGFLVDMQNIANFLADETGGYEYMVWITHTGNDEDYLGAIACRESTFHTTAIDGQYTGLFQLSHTDWNPILPNCSQNTFRYYGCDGFNVWQTQDIAALYYAQTRYGGATLWRAWANEVYYNYW